MFRYAREGHCELISLFLIMLAIAIARTRQQPLLQRYLSSSPLSRRVSRMPARSVSNKNPNKRRLPHENEDVKVVEASTSTSRLSREQSKQSVEAFFKEKTISLLGESQKDRRPTSGIGSVIVDEATDRHAFLNILPPLDKEGKDIRRTIIAHFLQSQVADTHR